MLNDAQVDASPPQDLVAEQSVLGGMMLSKDAIADVVEVLTPNDFYRPAHQAVYDCVLDLYGRGEPADPITVSAELERRGELGRVGGAPYLHTLIATVPTAANAGYYAEIVAEKAVLRRLVEAGTRIKQQAGTPGADPAELLVQHQAALAAIATRTTGGKHVDRYPALDWHTAFATDFTQVDWLPGRFCERGQQVGLVGDGKVGKSLFVHEWLWRAVTGRTFLGDEVRDPIRVLYFDRENGLRDVVTRMQAFGAVPDDLAGRFDYRMFPKFSGGLDAAGAAAAELLGIVDEVKPDVVVLDTVSRFIAGKENDSDTWLQLYGRVHAPLKAAGIAGVRLDHMGKDADRGSRGSSAKSQDVDHVWEMTRTSEVSTYAMGVETVVTQIRMKRTHTRTGIGPDHLDITRRGCKGPDGMWLLGRTRHVLTAGGGARPDIQVFVDRLLGAGCPETSRDGIKTWSIANNVDLPGKNAVLGQVVREFKAQKAADHAEW